MIRLCVLNHSSAWADVAYALDRVATTPLDGPGPVDDSARRAGRQAAVEVAWLDAPAVDAAWLRRIPLFLEAPPERLERFLGLGREESYEAGQAVTERWSLARTFYVVVRGRLSVRVGDHTVDELGPGDHLGEIAAIDWGRDFSYGRTATVVATERRRCSRSRPPPCAS